MGPCMSTPYGPYPRHFLVPFEKDIRYFSSRGFCIQRSGLKRLGSGKISEFILIEVGSMLTGIPAGMTQRMLFDALKYTMSSSGDMRVWRNVAPGCRRRPSWMTAFRYGSFSTASSLGRMLLSGSADPSSCLRVSKTSGLARR